MKSAKIFSKKENFSDDYVIQCLKGTVKQRLEWLEEANEFVRITRRVPEKKKAEEKK